MQDKIVIVSSRKCGKKHVSYNTILGLEDEFIENGCSLCLLNNPIYFANKVCRKLKIAVGFKDKGVIHKCNESTVFYAAMVIEDLIDLKNTLKEIRNRLVLYVFDCWEPKWPEFEKVLNEINPYVICFAYKKAQEHFSQYFSNCYFMPQSMDVRYYHEFQVPKQRMFMQMGRRTEFIHELILAYLHHNDIPDNTENYVYEREKGKIIFPDIKQLAKEIASSWFFVCTPQNITNSTVTGGISEVTARFYEAMACKTMIIGVKPEDSFDELFPFKDAMLEVTKDNFDETIRFYLEHRQKYDEIVSKNYTYVMQNHRWRNRLTELRAFLEDIK